MLGHRRCCFGLCGLAHTAALLALTLRPVLADDDTLPGPRSPEDERASLHFADAGLTAELVAAEPQVTSPVAFCWDEHYALYVAEMNDYPLGPTAGRIRRLEDRDGDGRFEHSIVFADGLSFPNGVLFARGGLYVTAAPDLLRLEDTDGDGNADRRHVVFSGFAEGNQQLRANGLTWGLDGWIYGANGRSDGEIRLAPSSAGDNASPTVSIRTRDFRFWPDGSRFEAVLGQSQFGQATNDLGDRFLSWNTIALRHAPLDEHDVQRWPRLAGRAIHNPATPDETGEVFPRAPQPQTFNRESTAHYNALCGLTIYRGEALGPGYRGNAFVGESLSNLVHRRTLTPAGPTYLSRRGEDGTEFLAAADPWFHPVYLTTGPDGSLYIADFYRRWVEHPQFVPEAWRNEVAWQEGAQYGRIWRVSRRVAPAEKHSEKNLAAEKPQRPLDAWRNRGGRPAELVRLLTEANDGWHSDTVQRLSIEQMDKSVAGALEELIQTGIDETSDAEAPDDEAIEPSPAARARAQALWTLEAAGRLDEWVLLRALHDLAPTVREQAVRIAAGRVADSVLVQETMAALTDDPSPRVRFQLARAWALAPPDVKTVPLAELAGGDDPGGWIALAVCASAGESTAAILTRRINLAWQAPSSARDWALIVDLATALADARRTAEVAETLQLLVESESNWGAVEWAALAGFGAGLADQGQTVRGLLANEQRVELARRLAERLHAAAGPDLLPQAAEDERLYLVGAVATAGDMHAALPLVELIDGAQPAALATAAVRAVVQLDSPTAAAKVLEKWPALPAGLRRQVVGAAVNWLPLAKNLADAVGQGTVNPLEIDVAQRQALAQHADRSLAQVFAAAFSAAEPPPRDVAVADYQAALELPADRKRGAVLFQQHCLTCHTMFGLGRQVGPDLTGAGHKPKATLLVDLLDPSRQMSPDFLAYTLTTRGGRVLSGLLVAESASGVTLRRGEGADDFVPRDDVEQLAAGGKSLMPEGFEQKLSPQNVADLLEFMRLPERALLAPPTANDAGPVKQRAAQ